MAFTRGSFINKVVRLCSIIFLGFILVSLLSSCATPAEKRLKRVEAVALLFRPLEANIQKTCKVQVELSGSTEEKYKKSFPEESDDISTAMTFSWSVYTQRCQLKGESEASSAWEKNHQVVVKAAFCTLLQGFAVESPFSGLSLLPADVASSGEWIQILSVQSRKPILELHEEKLSLKATSNSGQSYFADYELKQHFPRPLSVRLEAKDFQLSLSDFAFQTFNRGEVHSTFPRELEAFSIFTKDGQDLESKPYARVTVKECE